MYEVEDNKVISSGIINSNGTGHGALVGLLAEQGVNVLICGGIGGDAQTALTEAGIELCAGAQGSGQAVEAYLKGELEPSGANCDHHHEEGYSCGSHEEGHSCGDSCGAGQMIKGFDVAVADMEVCQITDVHLMPEETYGMADPNAIFTMEIAQLPGS